LYYDSLSFASHIIVFTETWLKPETPIFEIFPGKYKINRHDRPSKWEYGVLIAVDSTLKSIDTCLEI